MEQPMKNCPRPICALPRPSVQQFVLNKVVQTARLIICVIMWGINHCWGRSQRSWQVYLMRGEGGIEQKRTGCLWNNEWTEGDASRLVKAKERKCWEISFRPPHTQLLVRIKSHQKYHIAFSYFSPSHLPSAQSVAFQSRPPSRLELVTAGLWHERANLYLTSHLPIDSHTLGDWRVHAGSQHHLSALSARLRACRRGKEWATQCFLCSECTGRTGFQL